MRIDKYLKVTRLVKRRSVAKELCDSQKILAGGKAVKGSYEVKVGDLLEIGFGSRKIRVRVTDIRETVKKEDVGSLYELLSSERVEDA